MYECTAALPSPYYHILYRSIHILLFAAVVVVAVVVAAAFAFPLMFSSGDRTFGWCCPAQICLRSRMKYDMNFKICFSHYENALGNSVLEGSVCVSFHLVDAVATRCLLVKTCGRYASLINVFARKP